MRGIKDSFSKLSAHIPIMKPNKLKLIAVRIKKNIIKIGWATVKFIKKEDVAIMRKPKMIDLLAVAPTNPMIISIPEMGAACNSNMVPLNLGKKVLNEPLDTL